MAPLVLTLVVLLPVRFAIWNRVCLVRNCRIARTIGIPIRNLIASGDNPVWIPASGIVLPIVKAVFGDCDIVRYSTPGWEFKDKYAMHQKLGSAVIHVSAGHDWLYLCDSDSVNEVFKRKDDFDRPPDLLQTVLSCFGPNVSTVQIGSVNAKLPVPHSMIKITDKDTRTFSLHVLSGAGFGKSSSFKRSTEQPEAGQTFEYRDSLALVLENCLLILVLGPKLVSKLSWPPKWKRIGQATVGFKFCMAEMLKDKKEAIAHGKPRSATFTSSLLRASKEQSQLSSNGSAPSGFQGLTEEEIYANLFVYNFAGHDTTAVVLNWTIYLLAAHPEVQDWISKEMNAIITNDMSSTWDFKEIYPRLNRCLAVIVNISPFK
ncbi:uncharacterized protein EAF01_004358 [Botrytis porri]|uniref:uncharacterized protein n=1 Tax=Botrytis porri TaxID=87229 RepID=UPI0018FF1337|nr:uncharacterized protein EAF01_004358 [Botrytis porri]KAF7908603.1 hypothetical protein EAF01_004358 [Botrytis porri]